MKDGAQADDTPGMELLLASIEASEVAHCISSPKADFPLRYVNRAFEKMTGYKREDILGRNCRFLQGPQTKPETVASIREALQARRSCECEILNYHADGTTFWNFLRISPVFHEDGSLAAFIGIQTDITLQREMERLESDRQKLELLGRFSTTISHEIKNALQPILILSETLRQWRELDETQRDRCIALLVEQTAMTESISREVLHFATTNDNGNYLNPTEYFDYSKQLLRNLCGKRVPIACTCDLSAHPKWLAKISSRHLTQVLLNLVSNALDAVGESGEIGYALTACELSEEEATKHALKPGPHIRIDIRDNGCGMDAETLKRAFETNFTKKQKGPGSGLGLPICRDLLKRNGGVLYAESEAGKGSHFTLLLPLCKPQPKKAS